MSYRGGDTETDVGVSVGRRIVQIQIHHARIGAIVPKTATKKRTSANRINHNHYTLVCMTNSPEFIDIVSTKNLLKAHKRAMLGKGGSYSATTFDFNYTQEINRLRKELQNNTYKPSPYRVIYIQEPKPRTIQAPAYRDKVVQHAVHLHLSPFYERFFIPESFACRIDKGTHRATHLVQKYLRQQDDLFVCQIDVSKYYPSINHKKLIGIIKKKVDDKKIINLLRIIIESTDSGTEFDYLFPPDSPFHTKGRQGIPIGNLTSQLFANIYLNELDQFAKHQLKTTKYVRYMDDALIFHKDKKTII